MTTVTPVAVEVRQVDRLAALNHHGFKEEADLSYWGSGSDMRQVDETAALLARHRIAATPPDALQTVVEALREIRDLHGEINPSNYDHDDACELNRQFVYALTIADQALAALSLAGGEHQPKGDVA